MSEILKVPYEISVWEDELVTLEDGTSYYQEAKKAIIGSDTMTSPSRVFNPILTEKVNGETTLTFSLHFKYFDEQADAFITNPIHPLLINERKVKLYYKDKWYDFIIKECEEDKEENLFTYTAKDIFVNELSKQGYNIEFDPELNNNLGTAVELGKRTIKNTDWVVDEEDSDLLQQTIDEPLYICKPKINFIAKNIDDNSTIELTEEDTLYIFYTYITNEVGKFLQFILERDRDKWTFDDNDTIVATNYRYEGPFVVDENEKVIKFGEADADDKIDAISIVDPYYEHQAYRLVYQQRTLYEPIMGQYVDVYKVDYYKDKQDVYKFTTTDYGTSALAVPYITQGTNFSLNVADKITGWDNLNAISTEQLPEISLSTYPVLKPDTKLLPLSYLDGLTSYLRISYNDVIKTADNNYQNFIFNSGFMDLGATIGNISRGEKYVFRVRAGYGDSDSQPTPMDLSSNKSLRVIVAFYKTETKKIEGINLDLRTFTNKDIILDFNGDFSPMPSIISEGKFDATHSTYVIDNTVQAPSLKYYYKDKDDTENKYYVWSAKNNKYIEKPNSFLDYYTTIAPAWKTVTEKELTDPKVRIGVFLGTTDSDLIGEDKYVFIEDIQIFKYLPDKDGHMVLPGNAPLASAQSKTGYYLKPLEGMTKDDIVVYYDKQDLLDDLGIKDGLDLIGIYNENCEKILSIKESKSNCFNILQTICETFECWLKINVKHTETGAVALDENHKPIKKISFKKYVGKENFAGFKYGINLNSIVRTLDSNEVVTKLIVADTASDYAEDGNLSISLAESNPTGENIIYNLDYYVQRGLLKNKEQYLADLGQLYSKTKIANMQLRRLEKEYIKASAALEQAEAHANVYTETRETAQKAYAEALQKFKYAAGDTYEDYIEKHPDDFDESLIDIVGEIYSAAGLLNNNSGVTTATREEYKKLKLDCEGAKEYSIVVSTLNGSINDEGTIPAETKLVVSDYIEGFSFAFIKDNASVQYNSSLNDKEFTLESDFPYDTLEILSLPDNYKLEYVVDNKRIDSETDPTRSFQIYDSEEHKERVRRFKLVPNSEYQEKYKGYEKRIKEKTEEKNKYLQEFENKYSQFIQEGTWESSSYIDSNLYYFDALQVSHTSSKPQVSYTISVTEVSEIEGLENYNFSIGEKTYIEDTEFFGYTVDRLKEGEGWGTEPQGEGKILPSDKESSRIEVYTPIKEEVILSEIEWHLDDPSENIITVQNYKTQFEDLFQRISATVQSVQYNEPNYSRAANILDFNGQINSDLLVKSLAQLSSSSYPLASGGAINTQDITIMDGDNTSFRWDKNGLSAYGFNEGAGYDLTSFVRMDKYGLYGIKNGDEYVVSSLDDLLEKAHFSLTWDGFRIKNSYGNGYVSISSDNDFEVIKTEPILTNPLSLRAAANNVRKIIKVKIGAIEKDENGTPIKYGININNDEGETVFTTGDDGNITITGTINAAAGNIGGFNVTDELSSGDFNQPGSIYLSPNHHGILYLDGLNEENDWVITAGDSFGVTSDGIMYSNNAVVKGTIYANNGEFTGYINAQSGNFSGNIVVGDSNNKYIVINSEGNDPIIASSDYIHNTTAGWMINGTGDAIFNNVSVRGAVKTAVFEYSEIEAVGGAFLFRPSSSIKTAEIDGNNIILTVEKPQLFKEKEWVKLSNCSGDPSDKLNDGGLTHVYQIDNDPTKDKTIILLNAAKDFTSNISGNPGDMTPQTDDTEDQIIDFGKVIDIVLDSDEQYYAKRIEDLTLENNSSYLIYYDSDKYIKQAAEKETLVFTTYVDMLPVLTSRKVTYIGNLSIVNSDMENTGERFLIATFEKNGESVSYIYVFEESSVQFYIQKIQSDSNSVNDLVGGALISFGYYDVAYRKFNVENHNPSELHLYELVNGNYVLTEDIQPISGKDYYKELYENGRNNYGIGINSSDNYVGLPERAISLFESKIHPDRSVKVTYDYKGILGTLPDLGDELVDRSVFANNMAGTQGIFTNNMYIGDNTQYLAFYTDQNDLDSSGNPKRKLKIKANQLMFEYYDEESGQTDYKDVTEVSEGKDGEDAISVVIESSAGNMFVRQDVRATLTCHVYQGSGMDPAHEITNKVTKFTWVKYDKDGIKDDGWVRLPGGQSITIGPEDIASKAIFKCEVEF